MRSLIPVVILVAAAVSAGPVRAESSLSCTGFITTLPATISTPGTWCLTDNRATNLTSGAVITIATSNVTLDCNGFRMQANAVANTLYGVFASNQLNVTIRNCTLRGFQVGVSVGGGSGHLIENNRIDASIAFGMLASGDGTVVRGNRITDTGLTTPTGAIGMFGTGSIDIIGNTIDGVYANATANGNTQGIAVTSGKGRIENNIIRNVQDPPNGVSISTGIAVNGVGRMVMIGNDLIHSDDTSLWYGIRCSAVTPTQDVMRNNTATGFAQPFVGCTNAGDNLSWIPF